VAGPQWLTGTLVNLCLFAAAPRLSTKQQVLLSIIPSLSALAHGLLFGPLTIFLAYFLPFIWLGNWLLMRSFLLWQNSPFFLKILLPAALKAALLFAVANFYFQLHLVPKLFLTSMGLMQLATASAGGLIYILAETFLKNKKEN
jgi:hypothetical protein